MEWADTDRMDSQVAMSQVMRQHAVPSPSMEDGRRKYEDLFPTKKQTPVAATEQCAEEVSRSSPTDVSIDGPSSEHLGVTCSDSPEEEDPEKYRIIQCNAGNNPVIIPNGEANCSSSSTVTAVTQDDSSTQPHNNFSVKDLREAHGYAGRDKIHQYTEGALAEGLICGSSWEDDGRPRF